MKIGIYGGTFDPIHRGHITAAQAAVQQLGLDLLLLIPASIPPHKALPEGGADAAQRLEMATLATAELSCPAQVLDVEVKRRGKSYTADTLRTLRRQYPEDELWLLMGTDMFCPCRTGVSRRRSCALPVWRPSAAPGTRSSSALHGRGHIWRRPSGRR